MLYNRRLVSRFLLSALCAALLLLGAGQAQAQILRVEEDWELHLGEPDSNSVGPQVLTTMSPNPDINGTFFTAEFNHRSAPTWTPGGISIHRWAGEFRMGSYDRADRAVMNTSSEVVTWTQALYFDNSRLNFKVYNGHSTTWGDFGQTGTVKLDCSWGVGHVNSYTPAISMAHSGPAYAGNRVTLLKITAVRKYTLLGVLIDNDTTERIVHQLVE